MDGELVPGGPTDAFLRVTGKPKSDFQAQLANWNAGAIALFLAEFTYQESHDASLSAAVETDSS